jgi:MutS domain V
MKAHLMYPARDVDAEQEFPPGAQAVTADLELDILLGAMAGGDGFLLEVARRALLCSLPDPETITYRQHVLQDCLARPAVVREIYDIAVRAILAERRIWWGIGSQYPEAILHRAVQVMQLFMAALRELRQVADSHAAGFRSDGFTRFFAMISGELGDDYFAAVDGHLKRLKFSGGVLVSASLGEGNTGTGYVLRAPAGTRRGLAEMIGVGNRSAYSLTVSDRDEAGARALSELSGRGINHVANALAQSADHILGFLRLLRTELAFYIGALNAHERLAARGGPACFPVPLSPAGAAFSAVGLYDPCLALTAGTAVTGNDVNTGGATLVMITGANQGGKSTFLRSVGLAQLMMQAGMFVAATALRASVGPGLYTHFKREEDITMASGKLDEELARMSAIADHVTPGSVLLCNESFASTNEREGSEIARQIIRAMRDAGIRVFFVTHLYDLARSLYTGPGQPALFLRAERRPDGRRTFRLAPAEPLPTSHGQDVYAGVFGTRAGTAPSRPAPAADDGAGQG